MSGLIEQYKSQHSEGAGRVYEHCLQGFLQNHPGIRIVTINENGEEKNQYLDQDGKCLREDSTKYAVQLYVDEYNREGKKQGLCATHTHCSHELVQYRNGAKDGDWMSFFKNYTGMHLTNISSYKAGKRHGVDVYLDDKGKVTGRTRHWNGRKVSWAEYNLAYNLSLLFEGKLNKLKDNILTPDKHIRQRVRQSYEIAGIALR